MSLGRNVIDRRPQWARSWPEEAHYKGCSCQPSGHGVQVFIEKRVFDKVVTCFFCHCTDTYFEERSPFLS